MELLSNCCGARVDCLSRENIGICSECKEGCGVEWVCGGCGVTVHNGEHVCDDTFDKLSEQKQ